MHPRNRVGFVYDEKFLRHKEPFAVAHVEHPGRLTIPYDELIASGILPELVRIPPRYASHDELLLCHSEMYVNKFKVANVGDDHYQRGVIRGFGAEGHYTYICQETYDTAMLAAGSALELTESLINNSVDHGFALIRPPGHHASCSLAAGFCFFNNVALAARYAITKGLHRVLIVDWDVHHGNGTQELLYEENSILYISLHRYDIYPGTDEGNLQHYGSGRGYGYNINIPWLGNSMGDGDYKHAFDEIILPVAKKFAPEMILVSCGFDAARGDPLGGYNLSIPAYAWMTRQLMRVARTAVFFEGGYNLENLRDGVKAVISTLLSNEEVPESSLESNLSPEGRTIVNDVKEFLREIWF